MEYITIIKSHGNQLRTLDGPLWRMGWFFYYYKFKSND